MKNVENYNFMKNADPVYGSLTAIEGAVDVPFEVKRVYYIYDVPAGVRRGFHSHMNLHQVLICVHGSVKILTKTPCEKKITELSENNRGLYIGPMIWREMYDFSEDAVLLVLASEHYAEEDYIRDYTEYEKIASEYWRRERNDEDTVFNV